MAKRFTASDKWRDKWFRTLTPELKLMWIYICDECNHAGIWEVDIELANFVVGINITEKEILESFNGRILEYKKDKWFIPKFIEFQYGNVLSQKNPALRSVIKELEKNNLDCLFDIVDESNSVSALRSRLSKKKKNEIYNRDKYICQYCLEYTEYPVVDHIISLSKDGNNEDSNLITCCIECNSRKTDMDLNVFYEKYNGSYKDLKGAFKILNGAFKKLKAPKDKDKDKDKDKIKVKDKVHIENFETFWKSYPTRNNKRIGKKECSDWWNKKVTDEKLGNIIINATKNFALSEKATTNFAEDPIRFLKHERYNDYLQNQIAEQEKRKPKWQE